MKILVLGAGGIGGVFDDPGSGAAGPSAGGRAKAGGWNQSSAFSGPPEPPLLSGLAGLVRQAGQGRGSHDVGLSHMVDLGSFYGHGSGSGTHAGLSGIGDAHHRASLGIPGAEFICVRSRFGPSGGVGASSATAPVGGAVGIASLQTVLAWGRKPKRDLGIALPLIFLSPKKPVQTGRAFLF